jgi:hypothetical protein
MSDAENAPSPTGPPEFKASSRFARTLASWKIWASLLAVAIISIGVAITLPIVTRLRAMSYFDRSPVDNAGYELSTAHADWAEKYGEWTNALRDADEVWDYDATDESLAQVFVLSEMKKLILDESEARPFSLRVRGVPRFPRLEHVQISGEGFTDEFLAEFFSHTPQMKQVVLGRTSAGSATMAAIARIPSITLLDMTSSMRLDDSAFEGLPTLAHLQDARIHGGAMDCVAWLTSCPVLAHVSFSHSELDDNGLFYLSTAYYIVSISLYDTQVTDAGLQHLASFDRLEILGLYANPGITAEGLAQLPDLPYLYALDVSAELLTAESVEHLQQLRLLKDVYVRGPITDPAVHEMADAAWNLSVLDPLP